MTVFKEEDNSALAEFGREIVLTLAVPVLVQGYAELVARFRNDHSLENAVKESGIDSALSAEGPEMAALRKDNKELVTAAEKIAERHMTEAVRKQFPDHAVVGEEHGFTPGSDTRWVFDPVDGTSAMIRCALADAFGLPYPAPTPAFGITAGIVRGETAIVGIVVQLIPAAGELRIGDIWIGHSGIATNNGKPVHTTEAAITLKETTLLCTVPQVMFNTAQKWGGFQALMEATESCITDQNCIGFMRLLGNNTHIIYEADLAYHDVAALIPILQGAGLTVTNAEGNPPRFPETAIGTEFSILATPAALHPLALACIRKGVPAENNHFGKHAVIGKGYAQKFSA
ncbi:MAG TPA: inositol monophosphatase family protein [Rickettsiales bacterium]|nr:inositol monophosphatase family protein [Rickettsiales bacterium]